MVCAADVDILARSVHTIKNTEVLVVVSKENGLYANIVKTKYMVVSGDQNARRSHNSKIDNNSFQRCGILKYLVKTFMNQNSIPEEIKNRLRSGNACYHSVQNLMCMSSNLLSKNVKIKVYRTTVLPVVLYGCENLLLTVGRNIV